MPLVRISPIMGNSSEHVRAISDGVHRGLLEAYGAPADDRLQLIHQHARAAFIYDPDDLGLRRTDDLGTKPGLRPEDVLIVLSPNACDAWSFGSGLASYVADDAA